MAGRDSAFLWETEMLRSTRQPASNLGPVQGLRDDAEDWVTLREASEATGVPTSTIRKWVRRENIPSLLEKTDDGYLRIVSMDGIRRWADEIGRDIDTDGHTTVSEDEDEDTEVDLTAEENTSSDEPRVPEGTMLVPLDAWNKMLNQLGNLHEAGQQLAEARERAAKAETEARFLRERLRDLREQLEQSEPSTEEPPAQSPAESHAILDSTRSLVKKIYSDWRKRRRS